MKKVIDSRFTVIPEKLDKFFVAMEATENIILVLSQNERRVKELIKGRTSNSAIVEAVYENFCFAFKCEVLYEFLKNLGGREDLKKVIEDPKTFALAIGKKERSGEDAIKAPFSALTWAILQVK